MIVGSIIGVTAGAPKRIELTRDTHNVRARMPEWSGWACIIGGVVAFAVFGEYGGLVPASFVCVFVSALGDRQNTLKSAAALGAAVTAFGVAVFYYGLHLQLPLFQWGA